MHNHAKDCWPTETQHLLLKAALYQGNAAIEAWTAWCERIDLDAIDYGSQRLIPLLYKNLLDHEIQSPFMIRYKGVYRRFWLHNHLLFSRVKPVIQSLKNLGIEPFVLKGSALVCGLNIDVAVRPMDDVDLLVHHDDFEAAAAEIVGKGWTPEQENHGIADAHDRATNYFDKFGGSIDLHRRIILNESYNADIAGYWDRSLPGTFFSSSVRIPCYTDQLFHTCVHGLRWNRVPPIRWVSDAFLILHHRNNSLDWQHLLEHSRKTHSTLQMHACLEYLNQKMKVDLPPSILDELKASPKSYWENKYFENTVKKHSASFFGRLRVLYVLYKFSNDKQERSIRNFLHYLKKRWNLKHWILIPVEMAYRTIRGVLRKWR